MPASRGLGHFTTTKDAGVRIDTLTTRELMEYRIIWDKGIGYTPTLGPARQYGHLPILLLQRLRQPVGILYVLHQLRDAGAHLRVANVEG
eukprot:8586995-Heterocapsa_arctica.AAC.1